MYSFKEFIIFCYAYSFSMVLLVYLLQLPLLITNEKDIVNIYYIKNFTKTFFMDFFFIIIYFLIACQIASYFNITSIPYKLLVLALTTTLLTGFFFFLFTSFKKNNSLFSQWFHNAKYKTIIYDVVLLSFIYLIYEYIFNLLESNSF